MLRRVFWLSLVAVAYLWARDWETRPIEHPPGVLVPQKPIQRDQKAKQFKIEDYLVKENANFYTLRPNELDPFSCIDTEGGFELDNKVTLINSNKLILDNGGLQVRCVDDCM